MAIKVYTEHSALSLDPCRDSKLCGGADLCVNKLGGGNGHMGTSRPDATGVEPREMHHFVGIDDQYDESKDSNGNRNGNRTSKPKPGKENNIMVTTNGTEIDSSQVTEARNNSSATNCTETSEGTLC